MESPLPSELHGEFSRDVARHRGHCPLPIKKEIRCFLTASSQGQVWGNSLAPRRPTQNTKVEREISTKYEITGANSCSAWGPFKVT